MEDVGVSFKVPIWELERGFTPVETRRDVNRGWINIGGGEAIVWTCV